MLPAVSDRAGFAAIRRRRPEAPCMSPVSCEVRKCLIGLLSVLPSETSTARRRKDLRQRPHRPMDAPRAKTKRGAASSGRPSLQRGFVYHALSVDRSHAPQWSSAAHERYDHAAPALKFFVRFREILLWSCRMLSLDVLKRSPISLNVTGSSAMIRCSRI